MVFGFFRSSKPAQEAVVASVSQLRTPSPTLSTATNPPPSPKNISPDGKNFGRSPSPVHPVIDGPQRMPPSNLAELTALINEVPPKTLHSFVAKRLPEASPQELHAFMEFFATLAPPPKLHCIRCHKDYVDVENDDRSCHVPHDDESAEVEYVGKSKGKSTVDGGTSYQTLWGCCGKFTEGDGSQGPPDGWCYEGKHTTDHKRARFRADSTPQDDKLISCRRRRCFVDKTNEWPKRSRTQPTVAELSEDEDEGIPTGESEAGEAPKKRAPRRKSTAKKTDNKPVPTAASTEEQDEKPKRPSMDVVMEVEVDPPPPRSPSPAKSVPKSVSMRPRVDSKPKPTAPVEQQPTVLTTAPESVNPPKAAPKPRKKRKSGAPADGGKYKPPEDEFDDDDDVIEEERPKRKKKKSI